MTGSSHATSRPRLRVSAACTQRGKPAHTPYTVHCSLDTTLYALLNYFIRAVRAAAGEPKAPWRECGGLMHGTLTANRDRDSKGYDVRRRGSGADRHPGPGVVCYCRCHHSIAFDMSMAALAPSRHALATCNSQALSSSSTNNPIDRTARLLTRP